MKTLRVWNLVGSGRHVVIRIMTKMLTMNKESICEILTKDMDTWIVCVCGDSGQNIGAQSRNEKSWKHTLTLLNKLEYYPTIWTVLLVVMIMVFHYDIRIQRKSLHWTASLSQWPKKEGKNTMLEREGNVKCVS